MFKKISSKVVLSAVALSFASGLFANEVNLYSHRHYDSDKQLYKEFEQQTGITVNVVHAKADELLAKMKIEGMRSPADLFITADVGNLHQAKVAGLLQPIASQKIDSIVPAHLKDTDNEWFALTKRARVILYNKQNVDRDKLTTYEAIAQEDFPYSISVRSSANAYNKSLLASIIANNGEDAALQWAKGVVSNMARKPKGNDRSQIRAAASGEADIAIANTYYMGRFVNSPDPADQEVYKNIGIFFPNQDGRGTHINISGAGVTKSAKNKDNAIKLLEFLLSPQAQSSFAQANSEYPVNKEVQPSELVQSWGEFKEDELSLTKIGQNQKKAVQTFQEARWQ
ncbi:MAG: Fe(3+) ABC transporter substrate-binding protein [Campylobacterota bacterium]